MLLNARELRARSCAEMTEVSKVGFVDALGGPWNTLARPGSIMLLFHENN